LGGTCDDASSHRQPLIPNGLGFNKAAFSSNETQYQRPHLGFDLRHASQPSIGFSMGLDHCESHAVHSSNLSRRWVEHDYTDDRVNLFGAIGHRRVSAQSDSVRNLSLQLTFPDLSQLDAPPDLVPSNTHAAMAIAASRLASKTPGASPASLGLADKNASRKEADTTGLLSTKMQRGVERQRRKQPLHPSQTVDDSDQQR
jgi:hypothetical protein